MLNDNYKMRKLVVLKSLIDFIWFVTCIPGMLLLLFFSVYLFINPESVNIFLDVGSTALDTSIIAVQVFGLLSIILMFGILYCVYLFRKTLRYFQRIKPFHEKVIENFYKIGYLLSAIGVLTTLLFFGSHLYFKSELKINLGISPYLMLICLGLFFMVLSEVFKVAKHAKEENELTI